MISANDIKAKQAKFMEEKAAADDKSKAYARGLKSGLEFIGYDDLVNGLIKAYSVKVYLEKIMQKNYTDEYNHSQTRESFKEGFSNGLQSLLKSQGFKIVESNPYWDDEDFIITL